jgi:K+-sensing histidine kinase KdpD
MSKLRIILAEAEIEAAIEMRTMLVRLGYHVMAIASTGHDLISLVREYKPDLVITEVSLEGRTDGIELATIIQDELLIPVVLVTSYSNFASIAQDKKIEPYSYIIKPLADVRLQAVIEAVVGHYRVDTKIRSKLSEAEKLKSVKSELISLLSHEGRSPLTSILMSADLLQRYNNGSSEAQRLRCLDRIRSSVEYLDKLLEDVLTLDRSDSQSWDLNLKPIELTKFCQQVIEDASDYNSNSNSDRGRIELNYQDIPRIFYTDPRLLQHILGNLLSNAIKYSPPKSSVKLELIGSETELEIRICDRGMGIPAEDIPKLFQPFFRASNSVNHRGTGLGLSIVKRLIENLSGRISVSSEEGKGSIFTLNLPLLNPN